MFYGMINIMEILIILIHEKPFNLLKDKTAYKNIDRCL